MKKLFLLFALSIFFSASLFAKEAPLALKKYNFSAISGNYNGKVFNGTDMDLVLTSFFKNESGVIVGKYTMFEDNRKELGVLSNLRSEGDYTIVADWKDKYGSGILRMLFSSDYKVFHGFWGRNNKTSLPWHGVKE